MAIRSSKRLTMLLLLPALSILLITGSAPVGSQATTAGTVVAGSVSLSDLKPCRNRPKMPSRLRCGSIRLPWERSNPSLGSLSVSFAVLPARDRKSPSRGAIIGMEGGPGYGSIGSARIYADTFGKKLEHRDLLLVDARGTGGTKAIDCPDLQTGLAPNAIGLAECADQLGPRFGSYRTAAIADDIDDIRIALGYGKVQVYGDSYGTFLAQSYAFRHPDAVTRMVLDSAYPVRGESGWYPSVWRTGIRSLRKVCDRTPGCRGNAAKRLNRFVHVLRRHQVNPGPFLGVLGVAGNSPPGSYMRLNTMIQDYLRGKRGTYKKVTTPGVSGSGNPRNYSFGMELTVSCNDYPMVWNKYSSLSDRVRELNHAIRNYPRDAFEPFTPREIALTGDLYLECLRAPVPDRYYEPPATGSAPAPDIPVLVIAGELDNVTSPAEGRATAALFPASKFFLWRNAGHVYSAYDPGSKGAVRIRRFLRG